MKRSQFIVENDCSVGSEKKKKLSFMKFDPLHINCKEVLEPSVRATSRTNNFNKEEDTYGFHNYNIAWRKVSGDGLDVDYAEEFMPKKYADELFIRLQNEIEYLPTSMSKVTVFGKCHIIPREHVAFGDEGLTYKFSYLTVPAKQWTTTLLEIRAYINNILGRDYNFVLVNRYRDGKNCIGEHRDDEKELDQSYGIVSLSLGAERDFILKHGGSRGKSKISVPIKAEIRLAHGSCLIMNPPTNTNWYHSLPQRKNCTSTRLNLTFRKVIKR